MLENMNEALRDIYKRNNDFMQMIIKKYRLKIKLDGILDYQSISIISLPELPFSFRVFATFTTREEGKLKQHKINLYNLMKKKLEYLTDEEIYEEREDFIKFVYTWRQTKYLFQVEVYEAQLKAVAFHAKQPVIMEVTDF